MENYKEKLKVCSKCKEKKDLSEFYFTKSINKHRAHCKKCNNKDSLEWKHKNLHKTEDERIINKKIKKIKRKRQFVEMQINENGNLWCFCCKKYISENSFHNDKSNKHRKYKNTKCMDCHNIWYRQFRKRISGENKEKHLCYIIAGCKNRSRPKWHGGGSQIGKSYNITIEHLNELWIKQNGICALSGILMTNIIGEGYKEFNCSVDRIDTNIGYMIGNMRLVCNKINTMRNNYTDENFIWFCKRVAEYNN
jgi:hypothetical protein